jgi:integrase
VTRFRIAGRGAPSYGDGCVSDTDAIRVVALRWGDVDLGQRRVHVRRRLYDGRIGPPKSAYGRRSVPLSPWLTQALWRARKAARASQDADAVFASATGGHLTATNVASRVLKPAARRGGVPWASFHTFRHTCATILFRHGANAVQVQRWLGHHSAAFTLSTYVHLLPDDLPDIAYLDRVLGGHPEDTSRTEAGRNPTAVDPPRVSAGAG